MGTHEVHRHSFADIHSDIVARRESQRRLLLHESNTLIPFKAMRDSLQTAQRTQTMHVVPSVGEPKDIDGRYRHGAIRVPEEISQCCGISLFGRVLKSFVFSTDVVTIRNCNADAVLAVYPFTCQPAITEALMVAAECPVFTGIAGLTTRGQRSVDLARYSEMQGAAGVVVNATTEADVIRSVSQFVDIPVVVTVSSFDEFTAVRIAAGAQIVNVAAGKETAAVVRQVRQAFPGVPIMASGGKSGESILETIAAGADAITWTPPSIAELEHDLMDGIRTPEAAEGEEDEGQSA